MEDFVIKEKVYAVAERFLWDGRQPTTNSISEETQLKAEQVEPVLSSWWREVPRRILIKSNESFPDTLTEAFSRIWQQALSEAVALNEREQHNHHIDIEESHLLLEDALDRNKQQIVELENKLREYREKLDECSSESKEYQAELDTAKGNLANEVSMRKQEEQRVFNLEQQMAHQLKVYEDAKQTFEKRIKEEQRHALDAVSKAEADVRYYRTSLGKVRDESARKEASLTKIIHNLEAETAKKKSKIDTQFNQVKAVEKELKRHKIDTSTNSAELAKLNQSYLAESNKNKRLEVKIKELEEELKKVRQKQVVTQSEHARRENTLRSKINDRDMQVTRANAKIAGLEKRLKIQEDEVRRLSTHL